MKDLLYELARRFKVGGILRSLDLQKRYFFRGPYSEIDAESPTAVATRLAALTKGDMVSPAMISVASWLPPESRNKAHALVGLPGDTDHDFSAPLRQMVFLSVQPRVLDLSLESARNNLGFIKRIVVLTKASAREAIQAVAIRHFPDVVILTDDALSSGALPLDHTARNTWLRRLLYRQDCIEANFLASDEDYLALRPLEPSYYLNGDIHTGYYFREDMGTWLGGSPRTTPYDGGIRNTCRLLREIGCPVRAFSSHMPQIINKSLCNLIFERFVSVAGPAYDEWSLYFNIASHVCLNHFTQRPYGTLGWPMRMGDWFPEITPEHPAFENYYPQSYEKAEQGTFVRLEPLGDLETKVDRTLDAISRAHRIEMMCDGARSPGVLALLLTQDRIAFLATGIVVAGKDNVRRILLINDSTGEPPLRGKLEMFMLDKRGVVVGGETVPLSDVCWVPFLPPARPGTYTLRFFASLNSGARLSTTSRVSLVDRTPFDPAETAEMTYQS